MKKRDVIIWTIVAVLSMIGLDMHAQQAFYVYQHDGTVNTFFTNEIDSITVSKMGVDSLEYDDYVTQMYWTRDTVYRISIAAIDSVGFVTPPTVLQQGVIDLADQLYPYILSSDSLTFYLCNTVPQNMLPHKNDILVYMESSDIFPSAFGGQVVDVVQMDDSIKVECTLVELTDIFKCYYSTTVHTSPGVAKLRRSNDTVISKEYALTSPSDQTFDLVPLTGVSYKPQWPDGIFSLGGSGNLSVTVGVSNKVTTIIIVREGHPKMPVSITTRFTSTFSATENIGLTGTLQWDKDFEAGIPIETPTPFVNFYVALGPMLKANAEISSAASFKQQVSLNFEASMNDQGMLTSIPRLYVSDINHSENIDVLLKGSIGIGGFTELGICLLSRNFARVNLRNNYYFSLDGDCVVYKNDVENATKNTDLYEKLKSAKVSTDVNIELKMVGSFIHWDVSTDLVPPIKVPLKTWEFVPSCDENYQIDKHESNSIVIDVERMNEDNVFWGTASIDMGVYDENNNIVQKSSDKNQFDGERQTFNYTFNNLSKYQKYMAYPLVKRFGIQMRATPEIEIESCPGKIAKVEVTDARYFRNDSFPNTLYYTIEAKLENFDNIEEWGLYLPNSFLNNRDEFGLHYNPKYYTSLSDKVSDTMKKDWLWCAKDNDDDVSTDFYSFVMERKYKTGVYVKKRNKKGVLRTIYGDLNDYILRYDTKPSIIYSNPQITNIDYVVAKNKDGSVKYYDYYVKGTYQEQVSGTIWMDKIKPYESHTDWLAVFEGSMPPNPKYYDSSQNCTWSGSYNNQYSSVWGASIWDVMYLRNGDVVNSICLNWSFSEGKGTCWVSASPAYSRSTINDESERINRQNMQMRNSVQSRNLSTAAKYVDTIQEPIQEFHLKNGIVGVLPK